MLVAVRRLLHGVVDVQLLAAGLEAVIQRVVDGLQLLVARVREVLVVALRLPPRPSPAPRPVGIQT